MLDHDRGPLPDRLEEFRASGVAVNLEAQPIASLEILFGSRTDGVPGYLLFDGRSLEVRKRLARDEAEFSIE
jgi:hypothetical protein